MKSPYPGISWVARRKCWITRLTWRKKSYWIGEFKCPHEAAIERSKTIIAFEQEIIESAQLARAPMTPAKKTAPVLTIEQAAWRGRGDYAV